MTDTVKTSFGSGGAGLAPTPGSATPDLATILRGLIDDIAVAQVDTISTTSATAVTAGDVSATAAAGIAAVAVPPVSATKGVADGLIAGAPTTPSSQAVDPGAFTDWNINISRGYVFVNSVGGYFAAQVDFDVSSGVKLMDIGQAMYAWLVAVEAGAAVTQSKVLGVAAALGVETVPNDAAITAAVGHANWTKLALLHASRTADAVVATTENPSPMEKWGGAGTSAINELQTLLGTVKTLTDELKNDLGEAKTLANANKLSVNLTVALANAIKTALNAIASASPSVQKG